MKPQHRLAKDFAAIIEEAVAGKYGDSRSRFVREIVEQTLIELATEGAPTVPTSDFTTDVRNQTICLWLIESKWSRETMPADTLSALHRTAYGLPRKARTLRHTQSVPDYRPPLEVAVADIPTELGRLNGRLRDCVRFRDRSLAEQAEFLAMLWADIIAVHPFQDGNGRTARFAAQLCLRIWGLPYLVTPKVRNDVSWKDALSEAIAGRPQRMADILGSGIKRALTNDPTA